MSVTSSQANIGNTLTDAAVLHSLHYTTLNRTGGMFRNLRGPVPSTKGRGVINGKAGQTAALPKSSDTLTLSQPRGADYAHPLALPCLKKSVITTLEGDDKRFP